MTEGGYQSKIIKAIEDIGGHVVNGNYTKAGEADLQCGYPVELTIKEEIQQGWGISVQNYTVTKLLYLAVEVKTEDDYYRVMSGIDESYNVVDDKKLKKHEPLQMAKIRQVRKAGGLALVAYSFDQVKQYVEECRWKS